MLRFHHVALGVTPAKVDAETDFLIDVLNFRRLELTPEAVPTQRWFETEDGKQVHLSQDEEHRPARLAHVAVELGDELAALEAKHEDSGFIVRAFNGSEFRTVVCEDPAGNIWELRGTLPV